MGDKGVMPLGIMRVQLAGPFNFILCRILGLILFLMLDMLLSACGNEEDEDLSKVLSWKDLK